MLYLIRHYILKLSTTGKCGNQRLSYLSYRVAISFIYNISAYISIVIKYKYIIEVICARRSNCVSINIYYPLRLISYELSDFLTKLSLLNRYISVVRFFSYCTIRLVTDSSCVYVSMELYLVFRVIVPPGIGIIIKDCKVVIRLDGALYYKLSLFFYIRNIEG